MKRLDALEVIAAESAKALIVCNIGFPCRELCSVGDRPEIFYMLGSMGLASSMGLGVAIAQPNKKIIAIDGDGALLMNLGSLSTIASLNLDNYLLIVLDNGVYGSTGSQPTSLSKKGKIAHIAQGAGVATVQEVNDRESLVNALKSMTKGVLIVKIEAGNSSVPLVPHEPQEIKKRFMKAAISPLAP